MAQPLGRVVQTRPIFFSCDCIRTCDVYVLENYQSRGLGTWLMNELLTHPNLQRLRRFTLVTRDAHKLYEKCGFGPLANPSGHMEIARPGMYVKKG